MITELTPQYVYYIPNRKNLVEGIVYISEEFSTSTHLCPCGCKELVVLPIGNPNEGVQWSLMKDGDNLVSFEPSVGNWAGRKPFHIHYHIIKNKIILYAE